MNKIHTENERTGSINV